MKIFLAAIIAGAPLLAQAPNEAPAGPPGFFQPPGATLFRGACASCHTAQGADVGGRQAPSLASLKAMPAEKVYQAMTGGGKMQSQAAAFTDRDKRNIAEFVTGKRIAETQAPAAMTNPCRANPRLAARLDAAPSWSGWSPEPDNARYQTEAMAGLKPTDVPRLQLRWAFGIPGSAIVNSQPTVAFWRVFVGGDNGNVYSMDAKTGCFYWSFAADGPGRFAPVVAPISGHAGSRFAVYFPTGSGATYALDAQNGKLLWQAKIQGLLHISNSAAFYDGRLFVPIAGTETMSGASPDYEGCRSRGGVAAFDANTGKLLWQVSSINEPLHELGKNAKGKQLWGPSGASVWNTPTIDAKRKRIYVGTGNSYGPVAAETSDSILALNMSDGKLVWSHQEFKNDSFMAGCRPDNPAGGNCPEKLGPDWDFGGSSAILQRLPNGKDVLLAAGKGGVAIALDPENNGKILWRTQLWENRAPGADGLVVFGGTADGKRVYYPLQRPGGGVKALDIESGKVDWTADIKADQRGQIGAAGSIPGMVFTGAWDGILRAIDADGKVVWSYNTHRDFDTVNGVRANGGSLGSPGPVVANGMVYASSGYIGVQNGFPGNVVLAFGVEGAR